MIKYRPGPQSASLLRTSPTPLPRLDLQKIFSDFSADLSSGGIMVQDNAR